MPLVVSTKNNHPPKYLSLAEVISLTGDPSKLSEGIESKPQFHTFEEFRQALASCRRIRKGTYLSPDAVIEVTFNRETCRWVPNRPTRCVYPTAKKLLAENRRENAAKL